MRERIGIERLAFGLVMLDGKKSTDNNNCKYSAGFVPENAVAKASGA
jgi:hypothetical protein